jgi:polyisoprenoid-binding protein YceI
MPGGSAAKMSPQDSTVSFQIDPSASRFTIKVSAAGMLSAMGHNPTIAVNDYSGDISASPDALAQATVRVTARADSLTDTDDVSQKDKADIESRMKNDVLETSRFPDITFESTGVTASSMGGTQYAANVTGNLTLHGTTRSVTIACQASLNGDSIRAYGEFSLKQTDYGIRLVSVAAGTLKVKDEVKCSFDFMANKKG